jgi:hypothetical protein
LTRFHQQCNFHLLTRRRELLEIAKGSAARFPLQVKSLLQQGFAIRDRFLSQKITDHRLTVLLGRLLADFGKLLNASIGHAGNARQVIQHIRQATTERGLV